jgi:hypothetical protein
MHGGTIVTPTTSITMTRVAMIMRMMMAKTIATTIKALAVSHDALPPGWSQNWSHLLATVANHSRISTSKALRGSPWAQGVASSRRAVDRRQLLDQWIERLSTSSMYLPNRSVASAEAQVDRLRNS